MFTYAYNTSSPTQWSTTVTFPWISTGCWSLASVQNSPKVNCAMQFHFLMKGSYSTVWFGIAERSSENLLW